MTTGATGGRPNTMNGARKVKSSMSQYRDANYATLNESAVNKPTAYHDVNTSYPGMSQIG